MAFMLVDRRKSGFARYCPTFAAACDRISDRLDERRRRARLIRNLKEGRNPFDTGHPPSYAVKELSALVSHKDANVSARSCHYLKSLCGEGQDISQSFPALFSSLRTAGMWQRIDSASVLLAAARADDRKALHGIRAGINDLAFSASLDSGAQDMPAARAALEAALRITAELARREGAVPISHMRLLRSLRKLEADEAAEAPAGSR
ncbi:MAG: hypothetical protein AB1529_04045 [Candidatus Micrarchaeota archaeon]